MSIVIKGIYEIDPQSVEFTVDGTEDGDVIFPEKAYEIVAIVNNKKFDTYGIIWMIDGKPQAFIDEDFEDFIRHEFKGLISDQHILVLNDLIFKKYSNVEFSLPLTVME
ncbi:MAG: hypothetical protein ACRBDI_01245 [Alphaproteobacteria bacterium]